MVISDILLSLIINTFHANFWRIIRLGRVEHIRSTVW